MTSAWRLKSDALVVLVLAMASTLLATAYARTLRETNRLPSVTGLEQQLFGAAAMHVCERGLLTPVVPLTMLPGTPDSYRPLIDFLTQRRESVACEDIPRDVPTAAVGGMQGASRYLLTLVEMPWRMAGLTWRAFDVLLGILFGLSIALAFVFARVFMTLPGALATTTAFMLSPLHLANIGDVRDYSKAPFFVASLVIVALLITRARARAAVIGFAALGGAVCGLGFGVRTDVAINLLLILAAAVVFLPGSWRATWGVRLAGGAAAIAAFMAAAAPILATPSSASNLYHWALLGYGHDFDTALGIAPGPYETGYFYDDSYVASIIDAYRGRTTGATTQVSVDMPEYTEASRAYYRTLVRTFPADLALRSEAALARVLTLPYTGEQPIHADAVPALAAAAIAFRTRALHLLQPIALIITAAVVLAVATQNPRIALAIIGIVTALGAYPAIQFQTRHFFHLELLPLAMLGACMRPLRGLQWSRPALLRAGAFGFAIAGLAIVPLLTLRMLQQRSATALLAGYESAATRVVADSARDTIDPGVVAIASAPAILPEDDGRRSMRSEQVMVETADGCTASRVALTFRYAVSTAGFDYSRTFDVPVGRAGAPTRVFFPILESGRNSPLPHHFVFDRIEAPRAQAGCIGRVVRFARPEDFPILIPAVLSDGWRSQPLHQTIRAWETPARADRTHD